MPHRQLAASRLGELLHTIAHSRRIQIIEELRAGERDVSSLQRSLNVPHSNVSQHLAALRAIRVVVERREGRHVFYRLRSAAIADWLVDAMPFLPENAEESSEVKQALRSAKRAWLSQGSGLTEGTSKPSTSGD